MLSCIHYPTAKKREKKVLNKQIMGSTADWLEIRIPVNLVLPYEKFQLEGEGIYCVSLFNTSTSETAFVFSQVFRLDFEEYLKLHVH